MNRLDEGARGNLLRGRMMLLSRIMKPISVLLMISMLNLCWMSTCAWATPFSGSVRTETVSKTETHHQHLKKLIQRQEVQKQLHKYGLSQEEALARIDALTDEEVSKIAGQLDQLPAGGYYEIQGGIMAVFAVYAFLAYWIAVDTLVITTKAIGCGITFTCSHLGGWAFVVNGYFYNFYENHWNHTWLHKAFLMKEPDTSLVIENYRVYHEDPLTQNQICHRKVFSEFVSCMGRTVNQHQEEQCQMQKQIDLRDCDE
ncbi:exported hypothetical protein [Nitrospina gracilis 3/211]|uniref:Uncharacterized protein n=1 Tax=Nitrospina gracilis (strain 3/211) TaxID=1266370 RepID=M1YYX0_NITG3|nr:MULTISPECIES: PA2779 family protein [Nitrospina]MCF8723401.1 hypothetical protein [Nitrospina sp. Nb-3]CCQ90461.1 exported hypothetical protein [Nitrospina gracilis 3/211]